MIRDLIRKALQRLRKPKPRRPVPAPAPTPAPAPPAIEWEPEVGRIGPGDQVYSAECATIGADVITVTARPDRTCGRLLSKGAPFVWGTRYSAEIRTDEPVPGVWPAVWAIGQDFADWPACGEIDIFECGLGLAATWSPKQTIHTTDSHRDAGDYGWGPTPAAVDITEWHEYSALWTGSTVTFAVDGIVTGTATYTATSPLRLVVNVALRSGVTWAPPEGGWSMYVRNVKVEG